MRSRPSVTDVAKLAGVSVGTVSNVLNRPERVTENTLQRVRAAIAELDFVPSGSARQLRAGVSQSVAAVLLDVGNPFFTTLARGIEDRLAQENLLLMLSSSDESTEREERLLRLAEQQGVRGMLVSPASSATSHLDSIRDRGTPIVLVDAPLASPYPSVSVDDVHGGAIAVRHLLEQGHRRIAFVTGPLSIRQCADRLAGARQALTEAGLDPDEALSLVPVSSLSADQGEDAAIRLLALPEREQPTAAFCVNDLVALGVLRTLLRHGVRVPQEIAVVGYDDIAFASMLMVPLTTVRQPMHAIGFAAADLLLQLGPGTTDASSVRFVPELMVRMSSDALSGPGDAAAR